MQVTFSQRLKTTPGVLIAYGTFALNVIILDWAIRLFAPDDFRLWLVPLTGWSPTSSYTYGIFFTFALIFQQEGRAGNRMTIALLSILYVMFGIWEISRIQEENYGNPYLTISPWRSVWTIVIPSIWVIVLFLPTMNRFCKRTPELKES